MDVRVDVRPALLALLLTACATTEGESRYSPSTFTRGGLGGQTLQPGECGLFVWRADAAKTFALFSSEDRGVLHIGKETAFTPTDDPLAPEQAITVDERTYQLALADPSPVEGGTRYTSGTLKTRSDQEWDVVIPVLGLNLCQPEATPELETRTQ